MFNEGVVNARDQVVRLQSNPNASKLQKLNPTFDPETNEISIYNDGDFWHFSRKAFIWSL